MRKRRTKQLKELRLLGELAVAIGSDTELAGALIALAETTDGEVKSYPCGPPRADVRRDRRKRGGDHRRVHVFHEQGSGRDQRIHALLVDRHFRK